MKEIKLQELQESVDKLHVEIEKLKQKIKKLNKWMITTSLN